MTKQEEWDALHQGTGSCLANSQDDEPVFVLVARDRLAATLVRIWCMTAELLGVNRDKIEEALTLARRMDVWRENHGNGKIPD